jgi:hypothetical protein
MRDSIGNTLLLFFSYVLALLFVTRWQPVAFVTYCIAMNQAIQTVKDTNYHNENSSVLN